MHQLALNNNYSPLSYFDPCSTKHKGIDNFHKLSTCQQIAVVIVTIFAAIFSAPLACLGGVAAFRALSYHFCQLKAGEPKEHFTDPKSDSNADNIKPDAYEDRLLVRYGNLTDDAISRLGELLATKHEHDIKNTELTDLLVNYTFSESDLPTKDLNAFLRKLALKANEGNHRAQLALTRPNNFNQTAEDPDLQKVIAAGFPQNTPLALLVKAGNLEGCQIILSTYTAENLLFADLMGNTVLHLAVMTGQMKLTHALMDRANELGVLEDFLSLKNRIGASANEMLAAILKKENTFKKFLDVADTLFGGEEINKARIGRNTNTIIHCRFRLRDELQEMANGPVKLPITLREISQLQR